MRGAELPPGCQEALLRRAVFFVLVELCTQSNSPSITGDSEAKGRKYQISFDINYDSVGGRFGTQIAL